MDEHETLPPRVDPDRPLTNPAEDLLGYESLAEYLAKLITTPRSSPEGFVIAACGPWGSGKTTILNFVEAKLNDPKVVPPDRRPVIIHFNPWWFHDPKGLLRRFLAEFHSGVKKAPQRSWWHRLKWSLSIPALNYADLLSEVVVEMGWVGRLMVSILRRINESHRSPERIRGIINAHLKELNYQILVILDDLDRLEADTIREIFRLVRSITDFPNTVYLMAFDEEAVVRALDEATGGLGREYIQKIVQLRIPVPKPDGNTLRYVLKEKSSGRLAP